MCWPLDGSPGCRVVPTGDTYKIDLSGRHQLADYKNVYLYHITQSGAAFKMWFMAEVWGLLPHWKHFKLGKQMAAVMLTLLLKIKYLDQSFIIVMVLSELLAL